MDNKRLFDVNVRKYCTDKNFSVYYPASINNPRNHAVMFVTEGYLERASELSNFFECIIFWPKEVTCPNELEKKHAVKYCKNPRLSYCNFFSENQIKSIPDPTEGTYQNGAFIGSEAVIGQNCVIMPFSYIGSEVILGDRVYVGSGAKLVGKVRIGSDVIIRENSVIGADGLSTDRNEDGTAATMPQFGGVIINDHVEIGANTVIARGAIDDTIIQSGSKIDNQCFISHNVVIGKNTFIVGESILFGSSSTGDNVFISGNSTVRNGIHIGDKVFVGMGAVITKDLYPEEIAYGNPARTYKK